MDDVEASLAALNNNRVIEAFQNFDHNLQQQAKVPHNYMVMYKIFLNFVCANREENWQLHLTALKAMIPYFFAHD